MAHDVQELPEVAVLFPILLDSFGVENQVVWDSEQRRDVERFLGRSEPSLCQQAIASARKARNLHIEGADVIEEHPPREGLDRELFAGHNA